MSKQFASWYFVSGNNRKEACDARKSVAAAVTTEAVTTEAVTTEAVTTEAVTTEAVTTEAGTGADPRTLKQTMTLGA